MSKGNKEGEKEGELVIVDGEIESGKTNGCGEEEYRIGGN